MAKISNKHDLFVQETVFTGTFLQKVSCAVEGQEARFLAAVAHKVIGRGVIHVCLDDSRLERLASQLAFFSPDVAVLKLPAWDCLPYDRVSPNPAISAQRLATLSRLSLEKPYKKQPFILLTTVNSFLQKVMPVDSFAGTVFQVKAGDSLDEVQLQTYLTANGYTRSSTVREAGEFAIRGGIIDLFPPELEDPIRLDLFGDEVETIKSFDPMSQRSLGELTQIRLQPMTEAFLDKASIARFRAGYRETFGAVLKTDPLYEAVSEGRRMAGMEHWLPLFHENMVEVTSYLPEAVLVKEDQLDQAVQSRVEQIEDFYQARVTMRDIEQKSGNPLYNPLAPSALYVTAEQYQAMLADHRRFDLTPFQIDTEIEQGIVDLNAHKGRNFVDVRATPDLDLYKELYSYISSLYNGQRKILIAGYSKGSLERLQAVLTDHGFDHFVLCDDWSMVQALAPDALGLVLLDLENGFVTDDLAIITETDILGDRLSRPQKRKRRSKNFIAEVSSLNEGDYIVHMSHGIGQFVGLETVTAGGAPHDCVMLLYHGGDKLYVPVENIDTLTRYGGESSNVILDRLGGSAWQARRDRVKRNLFAMADQLLEIAAARKLKKAEKLGVPEGVYEEFCARFPYHETEDQLNAIEDILSDFNAGLAMDRLVCGDVGFGKTEVALRAAFVAAMNGVQVALVVPTTLLARQHYKGFMERFQGLPLQIRQLSRLVTTTEARKTREGLKEGTVDIVIGTHALFSKKIDFKNLGLLIVDEEQHFGVKQKEKLKELKSNIHVLTLTATPIPRTLQMSLTGLRELSLIATPPVDRLAVRTFTLPFDPVIIREALMREHFRGGQSFVVCPRLEDLAQMQKTLEELVPEVKIALAHGQLSATDLEDVMTAFYEGEYDVLLSTNIVESGLDVPRANTMILHRADMFGLAQLYQLRGRVGRGKQRGYAYLTYAPKKKLSQTAKKRLHVIETLDSLGAGFNLASHDMDIRGAGNLLGDEQSGQIKEVGVELYQEMLRDAVETAKSGGAFEDVSQSWSPQINVSLPVLIPETFVPDLSVRINLYRRAADLQEMDQIDQFAAELVDRFGSLPKEVENFLKVVEMKYLCKQAKIDKFDVGPKGGILSFLDNQFANPAALVSFIARQGSSVKLRPDHKIVFVRNWFDEPTRLKGALSILKQFAEMATQG